MLNRKLDIVQTLKKILPEDQQESVDRAMLTWWANTRLQGGMRLSTRGYEVMHQVLALESWRVDLPLRNPFTGPVDRRLLLALDRKLEWPYYIDTQKKGSGIPSGDLILPGQLVLFSSREAMMATLYGNLNNWLDSLDPSTEN